MERTGQDTDKLDQQEGQTGCPPRRCVFTALHLRHGGVERAIVNQANALVRAGYSVGILCTYNLGEPAYALDPRVEVQYLTQCRPNRAQLQEAWRQKQPLALLREGFRAARTLFLKGWTMRRALRSVSADVILSTRHEHSVLLAKLRKPNTQLVAFLHHDPGFEPKRLAQIRRYYSRLDDFVLLNETLREEMRGVFVHLMQQPRLWALGNFLAQAERIAATRKKPLSERPFQLAFVGRLEPEKNPVYALKLFAALRREALTEAERKWAEQGKLVFCGDGSLRKELETLVTDLQLQDCVDFLGMCSSEQVQEVLLQSRALLLTSDSEGFGLVVLEALDAGTPVLARTVRVGPRSILSYPAGLLLQASSPGSQEAREMLQWLQVPEGMIQARAKQIVEEYSEALIMQRLMRIIEQGPRTARSKTQPDSMEGAQQDEKTILLDPNQESLYRLIDLLLRPIPSDLSGLMRALQPHLESGLGPRLVITANPEIIHHMQQSDLLYTLAQKPEVLVIPDGIGCVYGIRSLRKRVARVSERILERVIHVPADRVQQRIPGVELCQSLLDHLQRTEGSLFLFGAAEAVLDRLVATLQKTHPKIRIVGAVHGYVENRLEVREAILQAQPDVVLAALGAPAQELFLASCLSGLKRGVLVGVGGSFDVLSGSKRRAPQWMRTLNLEWLYRLLKEPRRIFRFVRGNLPFLLQLQRANRRRIFQLMAVHRISISRRARLVSKQPVIQDPWEGWRVRRPEDTDFAEGWMDPFEEDDDETV